VSMPLGGATGRVLDHQHRAFLAESGQILTPERRDLGCFRHHGSGQETEQDRCHGRAISPHVCLLCRENTEQYPPPSTLPIPGRRAARIYESMADGVRSRGEAAEDAAVAYLTALGLRVVERNVRFALGEIDVVCRDGDVWVFVEVKCRRPQWGDGPAEAVAWQK